MLSRAAFCLLFACLVVSIQAASIHNKRFIKHAKRAGLAANSKRYVVPSAPATGGAKSFVAGLTPNNFRRDLTDTHIVSLKRAHGASEAKMKRGELHPLLYYTQHYSRALGRPALMAERAATNLKREDLVELHRSESEARMRKRWESLHPEGQAPALVRVKRNLLSHLIHGSNIMDANMTETKGRNNAAAAPAVSASAAAGGAAANTGFSPKAVAAAQQGTVIAAPTTVASDSVGFAIEANDVGYFATITAGTPAKSFRVIMDSGSADFWLPSLACNGNGAAGNCGGKNTIGSTTSTTFAVSDPLKPWSITYGTGAAAGVIAADTIGVAGIRVANHSFGVTTQESQEFAAADVPFDGLMGMGTDKLSNQKVPVFATAAKAAGQIKSAQLGYSLDSVTDDVNESQLSVGGVDATKFTGELTVLPNISPIGFWAAALNGASVDGKPITLTSKSGILDTGTTLIIGPAADVTALHAAIPGSRPDGQGGFQIPCTTTAQVAFTFGDKSFQMKAKDLAFVPLNVNNLAGTCQSAISTGTIDNQNSWLIGDAFLKSNYFATNGDDNTIGLAKRA